MRKALLAVLITMIAISHACAIDRGAGMIDSATVEAASYDDVDVIMINLWSEIALQTRNEEWAILAGAKFGQASPDGFGDAFTWCIAMGVKFYATDFTSFSVFGSYQDYSSKYNYDTVAGTFLAQHRFLSTDEVISPFVYGTASLQSVQFEPDLGASDDFIEVVLTAGAGCDFLLQDNMALVFKGAFSLSETFDGGDGGQANGLLGSVGMKYYWE